MSNVNDGACCRAAYDSEGFVHEDGCRTVAPGRDPVVEHFESTLREDAEPMTVAAGNADDMAKVAGYLGVLKAKVEALQAENDRALERLRQQGIGMQIQSVNMLMFTILLDMVLGDESAPARWAFELRYQTVMQAQIEAAGGQVARTRLTAPGSVPNGGQPGASGLIIPGR